MKEIQKKKKKNKKIRRKCADTKENHAEPQEEGRGKKVPT